MCRISFFILLLLCCYLPQGFGAAKLYQNQASLDLNGKIQFLTETAHQLTIDDVSSPGMARQFQPTPTSPPNYGFSKLGYWFKVSVDYISEESLPSLKYLLLDYPYLDHIELYYRKSNGSFTKVTTGDQYPFDQRPINYHTFVLKVELIPSQVNDIYLRVKTTTSLQVPLSIWQPEAFVKSASIERMWLGIFFGAMTIMFFYNLFVYLSVREKSYLFYIAYVACMTFSQITSTGISYQLLWPSSPFLANMMVPPLINITLFMAIIFSREYLGVKTTSQMWDKSCLAVAGVTALCTFPTFIGDNGTAIVLSNLLLIGVSVFLLSMGGWGVYHRQRRAYFFFAAWLALCLGSTAKAALVLNIIPYSFLAMWGVQFGVVIELILLSLALADRMNEERSARLEAAKSALMASEEALKAKEERTLTEKRMLQQSLRDQLTGHPNRILFKDQLQRSIDALVPRKDIFSVFCIHLNSFHDINETLGYSVGDRLLIKFVALLEERVATWKNVVPITHNDLEAKHVAVIEGVYLALILRHPRQSSFPQAQAEEILNILDLPITVEKMNITIGGRVGIATWPNHGEKSETLLQNAKIAVRSTKDLGFRLQVYNDSINHDNADRLSLMCDLRAAVSNNQLELYFQPKVSMQSQNTLSVEALVRWNHPEKGLLGPDKFVDYAEKTGNIHSLTQWILRDAIAFIAKLNNEKHNVSVAVNISAKNLLEEDFVTRLRDLLWDFQIMPSSLTLEVVESSMIQDMALTISTLNQLEKLGVNLSIDDFGTGYSSLEYLKRLPVHELKIDRSFVNDMINNEDDELIVTTTLAIAHQRGMKVVAEGIEDKATFDLLKKLGCDIGQGYFISKPLQKNQLLGFLEQDSPWSGERKLEVSE